MAEEPRTPRVGIGQGDDGVDARLPAVCDPLLRAVDDVGIPVGLRRGLDARRVASRTRLGEAECGEDLPRCEARQVLLFLLVAAEKDDRDGAQPRGSVGKGDSTACLGELLHDKAHLEHASAQPIVFGGDEHAEEVRLGQGFDDLPRKLAGLVELRRNGCDLLARDLRRQVPDHFLIVAEEIVHLQPPSTKNMTEIVFFTVPRGVIGSQVAGRLLFSGALLELRRCLSDTIQDGICH